MLAAELCEANGRCRIGLSRPDCRSWPPCARSGPPTAVVLDWRLERRAQRRRSSSRPATAIRACRSSTGPAAPLGALPSMIHDDRWTMIVDKAAGSASFEEALAWALARSRRRSSLRTRPSASRAARGRARRSCRRSRTRSRRRRRRAPRVALRSSCRSIVRIGHLEVAGSRQDPAVERHGGDGRLDRARRAERVPVQALRARHRDARRRGRRRRRGSPAPRRAR